MSVGDQGEGCAAVSRWRGAWSPRVLQALVSAALLSCAVPAAGCTSRDDADGRDAGRLQVITTVAPITSIVAAVAGDRAEVTGLVPEGADSHTFEPPPSAAEKLARADVVYLNGLALDEPIRLMAEANGDEVDEGDSGSGDQPHLVSLGDLALPEPDRLYDRSFPRSEGRPNPHLWTAPRYAIAYARLIAGDLAERDPFHASDYQANLARFEAGVGDLDQAMRSSFATIPVTQRKLLTYHDAYAYFARDYGFEIIGAVQPTSFSEPTPKQVAGLIEQVRRLGVPAIFGSEVFPSPVLEQIGKEANVRYVDELRDDDLPGDPGDPRHSLIGLLRYNYLTITEALGGDASALRRLIPTGVDHARYPQ